MTTETMPPAYMKERSEALEAGASESVIKVGDPWVSNVKVLLPLALVLLNAPVTASGRMQKSDLDSCSAPFKQPGTSPPPRDARW